MKCHNLLYHIVNFLLWDYFQFLNKRIKNISLKGSKENNNKKINVEALKNNILEPSLYWCYIDILHYPAHKWNCLSYLQNYTLKIIQEIQADSRKKAKTETIYLTSISFERQRQRHTFSSCISPSVLENLFYLRSSKYWKKNQVLWGPPHLYSIM